MSERPIGYMVVLPDYALRELRKCRDSGYPKAFLVALVREPEVSA
jgi:hypothetical protein